MSNLIQPVKVSILLAARNEEANIERCLKSLDALQFPKENLEICIGDDDSSDKTAEIIQAYIKEKPQFKYYKISQQTDGLKGKANVLAQLAHVTTGDFLFFCDADIAVPTGWITNMLPFFMENTGIVVGLTRMKKSRFFADFLSLEWLFTLTVMRFFSLFNIGITGLGNNMAVSRKAYDSVGGYEGIGFSIVEDYALFMAIVKNKFDFVQTYIPEIIAISEPVKTFKELTIQRKRWMHGIMQSPLVLRICLIISALLIPVIAVIAIWDPERSLRMLIQNYMLITAIVLVPVILLKQKDLWKAVFLFWFYLIGISVLMLIIHMLPGKTTWKERTY
ncbi:glycosyltransferase [Dyadobacter subterraneus]|uniref:Glycosyltransferase n=1 Tax=Dyadobacter subterraneus TaxID=2773304 RepID=A0ABR9WG49_9BACT|nr:glycosyltransferase [Dyadobacter subterraneus]MBE9463311.1 glycosyltransferase [Dyadobacter subterraneus]